MLFFCFPLVFLYGLSYTKFKTSKVVIYWRSEQRYPKTLHTARSHADYDAACKRLLSEKVILAWIMKNCLKEYRNCSIQEIMDNYIEGEPQIAKIPVTPDETNIVTNSMIKGLSTEDKTITEGTVTYDIRFLATAPKSKDFIRLILNIEAQKV